MSSLNLSYVLLRVQPGSLASETYSMQLFGSWNSLDNKVEISENTSLFKIYDWVSHLNMNEALSFMQFYLDTAAIYQITQEAIVVVCTVSSLKDMHHPR